MKVGHHISVNNKFSSFVSRKFLYRRLCGNTFYDVSKYSYDDPTSSNYEGECIYYQVNDGRGKCEFRPNIELDEDEKPVCKKGWGPEPTTMNITDACTCCANPDTGDECNGSANCTCPAEQDWSNTKGYWECEEIDPAKGCPPGQVRKGSLDTSSEPDQNCVYCNWNRGAF